MGPIEALFVTIQVIIAIVGVVRGYAKELGNTLVFMAAIFFSLTSGAGLDSHRSPTSSNAGVWLCAWFNAVGFVAVFLVCGDHSWLLFLRVMPVGHLILAVSRLRAPEGTILSLLIGLLNGYLVAGTIWYYANLYGYPFMNVDTTEFSSTANFMLTYLPQNVVANPVAWMVPVALLILLRVRG